MPSEPSRERDSQSSVLGFRFRFYRRGADPMGDAMSAGFFMALIFTALITVVIVLICWTISDYLGKKWGLWK